MNIWMQKTTIHIFGVATQWGVLFVIFRAQANSEAENQVKYASY